ncbi:hypothetical protein [Cardinium endosymbiont of Nabis limbatus]|uniref:hypothetical protein n=1 Tax=Cardinium endosymbiont of Nabis limbatus TaxID=3066217 RepID=UPI003AF36EE0
MQAKYGIKDHQNGSLGKTGMQANDKVSKEDVKLDEEKLNNLYTLFYSIISEPDNEDNLRKLWCLLDSEDPNTKELAKKKNKEGLTLFGLAIKEFCKKNLNPKIELNIHIIIMALLGSDPIKIECCTSNESETGDNEIHLMVRLHSTEGLSQYQKGVLKALVQPISSNAKDLAKIKGLKNPVNALNKKKETPLHVACKSGNVAMAKILFKWTNLTIEDIDGNSAVSLILNNPKILYAFLDAIEKETIHEDRIKEFYSFKNREGRSVCGIVSNKVAELSSTTEEGWKHPKLVQYMECIYHPYSKPTRKPNAKPNPFYGYFMVTKGISEKKLRKITKTEAVQLSKEKCSICFENFNLITCKINRCGHYFHRKCLAQLFCNDEIEKNKLKPTCPNCRGLI